MTVPIAWKLDKHATKNRKFASVQDFIRELVRRDIENWEKQEAERKTASK